MMSALKDLEFRFLTWVVVSILRSIVFGGILGFITFLVVRYACEFIGIGIWK